MPVPVNVFEATWHIGVMVYGAQIERAGTPWSGVRLELAQKGIAPMSHMYPL